MKALKFILFVSLGLAAYQSRAGIFDYFTGGSKEQKEQAPKTPSPPKAWTAENEAERDLQTMVNRVSTVSREERQRRGEGIARTLTMAANTDQMRKVEDLSQTLPPIENFAVPVLPDTSESETVIVEIFASTEKSTDPKPGDAPTENWLNEAARGFNAANFRTSKNHAARLAIRRIASGTGYQFIIRPKFDPSFIDQPEAYSPSSSFWVRMVESHGIKTTQITDSLVGNVAGIVIKKDKLARLGIVADKFGIAELVDAVNAGRLRMGYTNPFESTTGLNLLTQVLTALSEKLQKDPASREVAEAFRKFQAGVPTTYETTLQMRDAIEKGDRLDAMVMEYQTYVTNEALKRDYQFIPFGERHDNPLYAVGDIDPEKMEVLQLFKKFIEDAPALKAKAFDMGFDRVKNYKSPRKLHNGDVLRRLQSVWKSEKSAGAPVAAIFLGDISGSMKERSVKYVNGRREEGKMRITMLSEALTVGANFIKPENKIGVVLFDGHVTRALDIKPFDEPHKQEFLALAQGLSPAGSTAMYDGITMALHDLIGEAKLHPGTKLVLIVLSDGASGSDALSPRRVKEIVAALKIPTYILGLEADDREALYYGPNNEPITLMGDLKNTARASGGDAFHVKADEVENKISNLLNSQL
ncbi:MAG: VWA domain-containing protein [Bdellovibrionales bacterium]